MGKIAAEIEQKHDEAIELFNRAIKAEPSYFMAYNNLAGSLMATKQFEAAIKTLETGLEFKNDDALTLYNLGYLLETIKNDLSTAMKYYRKSIRANPQYVQPKIHLSNAIMLTGGDPGEAEDLLKDVLSIEPKDVDALFNLSVISLARGNLSFAKEYYKKSITLNPNKRNIQYEQAINYR